MITWYYGVDKRGNVYRAPIDLDTLIIDYLHDEPWHEPPLVSRVRTRCSVCHHRGGCKHTHTTGQGERA